MPRRVPAALPLLLLCALAMRARVAEEAGARSAEGVEPVLQRYRTPREFSRSGDFQFRYPPELVVLQDYVYRDASVPGPRHIVVLRHRDAQPGDLRSIEINMLRSLSQRLSCKDYAVCADVGGVVVGTDSEDPGFRRSFEAVVRTFEAR